MAINNPYVPGDPACYDLKWLVEELKRVQTYQVEEAVTAAAASAESASNSAAAASESAQEAAASAADTTQADAAAASAQQAAASAQQAAASAADTTQSTLAERWAEESEAWAVGTKDGTPVSSGASQYQNNSKYWAEQAAQSQGTSIFGITTEYFDRLTLSHTEWGYRYGIVSTDGILLISLSMQESNSNQIGELVVNIAKMNGTTPIEYAIAQETGSGDTDRWTAVETAAFMKVNAGDRIRLGCYRHRQISGTPTMVADTNIIAIGTTLTLDAAFAEPPVTLGAIRGVGQISSVTLEKEEK